MRIANPIYDVVFKYMMEDLKVAKVFISAIIGEEVLELEFCPQEYTLKPEGQPITLVRMDFSAKIKLPDGGWKTVMIELQKAQLPTDIMRFRWYLGKQYTSRDNIYRDEKGNDRAMPIYCIFFLGRGLGISDVPVLTVSNTVKDQATGKELSACNKFIEGLHHQSWIVQISNLKKHRRNDLEILLSIFDQNNTADSNHIVNVKEEDFPEEYRDIIRRLKMASESVEVEEKMIAEDFFVRLMQKMSSELAEKEIVLEEKNKVLEEKNKSLEEKDKVLEEKDKVLEEKDKVLEEKDKSLEEKDKALEERNKALEERNKALEEKIKEIEELRKLLNLKQDNQ